MRLEGWKRASEALPCGVLWAHYAKAGKLVYELQAHAFLKRSPQLHILVPVPSTPSFLTLFSPALACISAFPHTPTPSTLHVNGDIQREHARIVRNACILRIPSRIQAGWTGFWAAALSSCILRNLMKWFEFCYKGNSVPGVGGEHLCREAAGRVSLGGLSRRPAFHSLG